MLKNLLVLPDGQEIFSGVPGQCAIKSVKLTERVNDGKQLTVGSVCAQLLEAQIIVPDGTLQLHAGDEVTLYKVDDAGFRRLCGIFVLKRPTRKSKHCIALTGYDRVSLLARDMTRHLASFTAWPYTVSQLAWAACAYCGTELEQRAIPYGDLEVQAFTAQKITGTDILSWIGQLIGRFVRATPEGKLEFAWYAPAAVSVGPGHYTRMQVTYGERPGLSDLLMQTEDDMRGNISVTAHNLQVSHDGAGNVFLQAYGNNRICYLRQSLQLENFTVQPVQQVQLRCGDAVTAYPDVGHSANTYTLDANPMLGGLDAQSLASVAQSLYLQLREVCYTPCRLRVPANSGLKAGDIVDITDTDGVTFCAYIMTRTNLGQTDTLECTGMMEGD